MPRCLLMILLTAWPALHAQAGTVYVQSLTAKLMREPAVHAAAAGLAVRGAALEAIASQGAWLQVRHGDGTAWIAKLLVAAQPPLAKVTALPQEAMRIDSNARRRASTVTTAGAARGLTAEDRARGGTTHSDYPALQEMEAVTVSEDEVRQFMAEGRAR